VSDWLVWHGRPSAGEGCALIVPHLGCGAGPYVHLARHIPAVPTGIVRLPAREGRLLDPPATSIAEVVERVVEALDSNGATRCCLFGHCAGAWIAFEIARALERRDQLPVGLYVSGSAPPHLASPLASRLTSDADLLHFMASSGYTSTEVLQSDDLAQLLLPALRADLAMLAAYRYRSSPPLSCPISAWHAESDQTVSLTAVGEWAVHTSARFRLHTMPGDHFSVLGDARETLARHVLANMQADGLRAGRGR
jgi:surfactin synthase thioesterase subunit